MTSHDIPWNGEQLTRQEKRLARFEELMAEYGMAEDDYDDDDDAEENPRPYIRGEQPLEAWVCVTVNYSSRGGATHYFLPKFEEAEAAIARAEEYAQDDLFEELPVAVVNLDTGFTLYPVLRNLNWRP